ncbi:tRNA ligase [Coemansia sp. RSA 1199]|nr:tRNA ligase [Coemansia sp. RSA 1199]
MKAAALSEDSDDMSSVNSDDEEASLAERLQGIDLSGNMDANTLSTVWKCLSQTEQNDFIHLVNGQDVEPLVTPWHPWWIAPSALIIMPQDSSEASPIPAVLDIGASIQSLSGKVHPSVLFQLIQISLAYVYMMRHLNGEPYEENLAAAFEDMIKVAPLLASQVSDVYSSAIETLRVGFCNIDDAMSNESKSEIFNNKYMSTDSITSVKWGSLTRKEQASFEQLLLQLNEHAAVAPASKKVVGKTISEFAGREVTSWKSTDYLYKKEPCPLPSQARGLFTCTEDGEVRIAARGYNKFFNINEVPKTNWSWIEDNTHGPYEMTVKEDGCLILASGLDGGKTLLVTSKHAIVVPHAQMGRQWMEQHLSKAGKTVVEFATFLYERNATAVFELCDDAFEEHILEYPERTRGLYLHGINRNSVELDTWPSTEVAKVAEYFGFNVVKRFEFNSALEGRELADSVRKDEMLEGRVIEGFVMRCKLNGTDEPYMFKIKYDIPYLMFREWRVVTDCILSKKPYRTSYPMTKNYAAWVKQQIRTNPADFASFRNQKGHFVVRKRFFEFYKQYGASEEEFYDQISQISGGTKVLLMPVASIGCGKTTISVALSRLFGFGHIQSDNTIGKKNARGLFQEAVLDEFGGTTFVIADRSNHIAYQRKSLTSVIRTELVNCQIVALCWAHDKSKMQSILDKNVERVIARGEAHQVFTPNSSPEFRRIMNGHIRAFAPLDLESESDKLINEVIELDSLADSAENLQVAVEALCKMFPDTLKLPSESEVNEALEYALAFEPEVQVVVDSKADKK